jgi:tetratricopeptide (TPR) repeat protein
MTSPRLILVLLYAICLSLGSVLEPWYQNWAGGRNDSAHVLNMMIGDSRTVIANHFFAKADAYFHKGYYPTIFDTPKKEEESHMAGQAEKPDGEHHEKESEHDQHEEEGEGFLEPPKDWIDRFSRNFFPSHHSHLEKEGEEREILPWLSLSADLDPQRVETYTIASYWLRRRLGKVNEAEQFLRQGLRANPESYEIYFELGRIYDENRHESKIARNLWEVALRKWKSQQERYETENNPALKPDVLIYEGITGRLARLEESEGNFERAISYLELLKKKSPLPDKIQKQIDELRAKSASQPRK